LKQKEPKITKDACGKAGRELNRKLMYRIYLLSLPGVMLLAGCNSFTETPVAAAAPVATPTPENFGLYTDSDLQVYADTIDLKIQEALRSNNTNLAQELGRKRQELIAEFNRRGLKRKPVAPARHLVTPVYRPHPSPTPKKSAKKSRTGLPGEE
jgi:hypothetical protein